MSRSDERAIVPGHDEDPGISAELRRRIAVHFRAVVPHMSDEDFEQLVADMAAFRYRWEGAAALDRFPVRARE